MTLKNTRLLGRFTDSVSKREVNIHKGHNPDRGADHYYYLKMGKRIYISDREFHENWKIIKFF